MAQLSEVLDVKFTGALSFGDLIYDIYYIICVKKIMTDAVKTRRVNFCVLFKKIYVYN